MNQMSDMSRKEMSQRAKVVSQNPEWRPNAAMAKIAESFPRYTVCECKTPMQVPYQQGDAFYSGESTWSFCIVKGVAGTDFKLVSSSNSSNHSSPSPPSSFITITIIITTTIPRLCFVAMGCSVERLSRCLSDAFGTVGKESCACLIDPD